MDFYLISDELMLLLVKWATAFVIVFAWLLLLLVLTLRARRSVRDRQRRRFLTIWQPILTKAAEVATADLPHLARRDLTDFLMIWNHLHESLLDESKDRLNQIAEALNIEQLALEALRRGNLRKRLLAILTLGQLRKHAAWDQLLRLASEKDTVVSLVAARALVMIDSEKVIPLLIPILVKRPDWPASRVATLLETAGADVISDQIAKATTAFFLEPMTEDASQTEANRLIQYLALTHRSTGVAAVQTIVARSQDPLVLAACLRLVKSVAGLTFARECLVHDDWRVRVQAASALGRVGQSEDEANLIPLLSDREWWVRYRAAQALSRLPLMRESKLTSIQAAQVDPFARQMLAQVIAEVQLQ